MDFDLNLKNILTDLGLSELQSKCYLTLVKSGGLKVTQLAKEIGVNRPNTYSLIEKLHEFDLVYEENLVSGKVIYAKSYQTILNAIEERKNDLEDNLEKVKEMVPIFESLLNNKSSYLPKIRTYETKHGLDTIADDILSISGKKEILLFSNQQTERGIFSRRTHDEFIKKRVEKGIKVRVLVVDNNEGENLKESDKDLLRETRILPFGFDFHSEIYIYDNKIAMLDVKEEIIGVIIESEELYNVHRQMFELIWGMCR